MSKDKKKKMLSLFHRGNFFKTKNSCQSIPEQVLYSYFPESLATEFV